MSKNKNVLSDTKDRMVVAAAIGATVVAAGGALYENGHAGGVSAPADSDPHRTYVVKAGDTEDLLADKFGGRYDKTAYEDMVNSQLPERDRRTRNIKPGERLRLPN